jgi:hypothetical protein
MDMDMGKKGGERPFQATQPVLELSCSVVASATTARVPPHSSVFA